MLETEQFWGTIDFHSIFFSYYGSQWCPKTAWLQTFFKISSFVFCRTKTFIQVWNYLRVSKWWQNFHFWVNYPFKSTVGYCRRLCGQGHNFWLWFCLLLPCDTAVTIWNSVNPFFSFFFHKSSTVWNEHMKVTTSKTEASGNQRKSHCQAFVGWKTGISHLDVHSSESKLPWLSGYKRIRCTGEVFSMCNSKASEAILKIQT